MKNNMAEVMEEISFFWREPGMDLSLLIALLLGIPVTIFAILHIIHPVRAWIRHPKAHVKFIIEAYWSEPKDGWGRALAFELLGRHEKALHAIDKAIKLNPKADYRYVYKSNLLKRCGRDEEVRHAFGEEGIRVYNEAIRLNPNDGELYINKGNLLEELGRNEEALLVYEHAIELSPASYRNRLAHKGNLLEKLGRNEEALLVH